MNDKHLDIANNIIYRLNNLEYSAALIEAPTTLWNSGGFGLSDIDSGFSLEAITESVKKSLGYLEKPLVKCGHCGQWGAAYCACKHCGAAIDPE